MSPRLVPSLALLATLGLAGPAFAGAYTCQLPRALLCETCARDLTITLTPGGACRVSFTPGDAVSPGSRTLPLRFEVLTAQARPWRPRVAWRPTPPSAAASGRCFSFNGNKYCE